MALNPLLYNSHKPAQGYTQRHSTYSPQSHHNCDIQTKITTVVKDQLDKIVAVWYNRGYRDFDAVAHCRDENVLYNNIFRVHPGLIPQFLSLFSDELLAPIPDDVWYELANDHLKGSGGGSPEVKELLLRHAPQPILAKPDAVDYFYERVDQPYQVREAKPHVQQTYRPKHPNTYIDKVSEVLSGQIEQIKAVWSHRGYKNQHPFSGLNGSNAGKKLFSNFFNVYPALIADFLSLFSDTTLRSLPEEVWYDLANYHLLQLSDPAKKQLLGQNAPSPNHASREGVCLFLQLIPSQASSSKPNQKYTPKDYRTYFNQICGVLDRQMDKVEAVWHNKGYRDYHLINTYYSEVFFRCIFEERKALVPKFLSLFSDDLLNPLSDDVWYDLANHYLLNERPGTVDREILRRHAPYPTFAKPEAISFFYQQVGGQPYQAQPVSQAYSPKHPKTYIDECAEVIDAQIEAVKEALTKGDKTSISHEFKDYNTGMRLFKLIFDNYQSRIPDLLSFFSGQTLRPFPDDIWYDLANYSFIRHHDEAQKEQLRQNAPYPHRARREALEFFHKHVGGQPPAPKTKLEGFSAAVNPAPSQGQPIISSSQLPQQPASAVRLVSPAEPTPEESTALQEQLRKMNIAIERNAAEIEQLRKEWAQKNEAAPIEKFTCNICQERIIEVIWLPCRHMYCEPCSNRVKSKHCPNCKETAAKVEKLFFAN